MNNKGFSLLEVLIAILLIAISLLGLLVMQARGVGYLAENNRYNMAIELSGEYVDLVRSYKNLVYEKGFPNALYYQDLKVATPFWESGKVRKVNQQCTDQVQATTDTDIAVKLACWNAKAEVAGMTDALIEIVPKRNIIKVTLLWSAVENSSGSYNCYSEIPGYNDKCYFVTSVEI